MTSEMEDKSEEENESEVTMDFLNVAASWTEVCV